MLDHSPLERNTGNHSGYAAASVKLRRNRTPSTSGNASRFTGTRYQWTYAGANLLGGAGAYDLGALVLAIASNVFLVHVKFQVSLMQGYVDLITDRRGVSFRNVPHGASLGERWIQEATKPPSSEVTYCNCSLADS